MAFDAEKHKTCFMSVCKTSADVIARCGFRATLWLITVLGSLFPPVYAAKAHISLDYYSMAAKVNEVGLFRDFFYVVIVIALLGICNVMVAIKSEIDGGASKPNTWVYLVYTIAIFYFIYNILYGTGTFSELAASQHEKRVLSETDFDYDMAVIQWMVVAGLLTEVVIAFREG